MCFFQITKEVWFNTYRKLKESQFRVDKYVMSYKGTASDGVMGVFFQIMDEAEDCGEKKEKEKEKVCRICLRGLGLIFCCMCPAAYHSECHDPPLQTRAR